MAAAAPKLLVCTPSTTTTLFAFLPLAVTLSALPDVIISLEIRLTVRGQQQ
jgi:hypothetical protein